jgi:uncharacterized protein CbrC (UPF0167 family)
MDEALIRPTFRFYPHCWEDGRFEASQDPCEVCGRPCGWRYVGDLMAWNPPSRVCPRCLHDGALIDHLDDQHGYSCHDVDLPRGTPWPLVVEVTARTPSVTCFNPFPWPVHGDLPMAFVGNGDTPRMWDDLAAREAMQDTARAAWKLELTAPTPYLLVFRSLDGGTYRAILDLA